jgi:hypothetical protein
MLLIYAVIGFTQLYLFCPAEDFMCMSDTGSVIKQLLLDTMDIFTK